MKILKDQITPDWTRVGKFLSLLSLLAAYGCASPDAFETAMQQHASTYSAGQESTLSTIR